MELHEVFTARGGQKGVASSAGEVHALRADQDAGWWEVPRFITQCINDLFARQQQQSTSGHVNYSGGFVLYWLADRADLNELFAGL
jgi:hypothetical protein